MRKQTPSGFAWGTSSIITAGRREIRFTKFAIDYFTAHPREGFEADGCNKHDSTIKLETLDDSNGTGTTQYSVCSRRLSVVCTKGRRARDRLDGRGYERFIDSNDPPNMIIVFDDSNPNESVLKLENYTSQGYLVSAGKPAYWTSSGCIRFIINHLVDNWKKLLEVATAHNVLLIV
jgi:hypothetical protein